MPAIEIRICAEGALSAREARELAALGLRSQVEHVVLDGTLVDHASLLGVLERLRRAGLRIQHVEPAGTVGPRAALTHLTVTGHVGDVLGSVLHGAVVTEHPATTTAAVSLTDADDLFELLHRLEALGLSLHAVHVSQEGHRVHGPDDGSLR